jgi:hypothetical protein
MGHVLNRGKKWLTPLYTFPPAVVRDVAPRVRGERGSQPRYSVYGNNPLLSCPFNLLLSFPSFVAWLRLGGIFISVRRWSRNILLLEKESSSPLSQNSPLGSFNKHRCRVVNSSLCSEVPFANVGPETGYLEHMPSFFIKFFENILTEILLVLLISSTCAACFPHYWPNNKNNIMCCIMNYEALY